MLCWSCMHACAAQILKHAALSANLAGEEPIDVVMHNCYPGKDTLWQVHAPHGNVQQSSPCWAPYACVQICMRMEQLLPSYTRGLMALRTGLALTAGWHQQQDGTSSRMAPAAPSTEPLQECRSSTCLVWHAHRHTGPVAYL